MEAATAWRFGEGMVVQSSSTASSALAPCPAFPSISALLVRTAGEVMDHQRKKGKVLILPDLPRIIHVILDSDMHHACVIS